MACGDEAGIKDYYDIKDFMRQQMIETDVFQLDSEDLSNFVHLVIQ